MAFAHQTKSFWGRELEYVMPQGMYDSLAAEAPKNVNPRDWVIDYINQTYGLLGTVTTLHIEGENINKHRKKHDDDDEINF